jgi:hypothetical protein
MGAAREQYGMSELAFSVRATVPCWISPIKPQQKSAKRMKNIYYIFIAAFLKR